MTSGPYPPTFFVLGTQQHVGKTVTSVGVIAKLLGPDYGLKPEEIGYIKPVGQNTVKVRNAEGREILVDKDALLVTSLMGLQVPRYEATSPVLWLGGLTAAFIDDQASDEPKLDPDHFADSIRAAYQEVAQGKKAVIVEGTGQMGVGSVGGICNGHVINLLRDMGVPLWVLLVTRAGIGGMIDQTFPHLVALDHMHTRVDGLVVNEVFPDRLDKIRDYVTRYYAKVFPQQYGDLIHQPVPAIVGFVPMVPQLTMFSMRLIAQMFAMDDPAAVEILAPQDFNTAGARLIRGIKTINLRFGYDRFVGAGDAIVVGINANDIILSALLLHERLVRTEGQGLAGLILSSNQIGGLSRHVQKLIQDENLPTLALSMDSAQVIQQVEGWTVKIQPYDVEKKALITKTYREHLDLGMVFAPSMATP